VVSEKVGDPCQAIQREVQTALDPRPDQLTHPDLMRIGSTARLMPREIAVLRLISTGARHREVAEALLIGEETVRSHLKKVQIKLGVRNRAHAVSEALRQNLIP
jgi:DNA-binding CsgD family transcriptional regulator